MNTTLPQGTDVSAQAAALSEFLLLHTALGDGFVSPFPQTRGLVFSSAATRSVHTNLREAERDFRIWHDDQQKADHDALEKLEAYRASNIAKMAGRDTDKASNKAIKDLKDKLALIPAVTWRDTDVHKSTLIELLKRSAYNAMSYVDEFGTRLAVSSTSGWRLAADLGWISLTEGTNDCTLIRSSATGGSSIHSLAGDTNPKFSYFCSVHSDCALKLMSKVTTKQYANTIRGHAIFIPVEAPASYEPMVSKATLVSAMRKVFAKGGTNSRVKVSFATPELKAEWDAFLKWGIGKFVPGIISDASMKTFSRMPASVETINLFASRAAVTCAILSAVEESDSSGNMLTEVVLREMDLGSAIRAAQLVFGLSSGVDRLERRGGQAEKAREAFKSPERVVAAEKALLEAIAAAPGGKVPRTAAMDLPGVTGGLLDLLVSRDHLFTELKGTDQIRMGKTTRAYILKSQASMSPDEAIKELEEAWTNHANDIDNADPMEVHAATLDLAQLAYKANYPAVPITKLTSAQIRLLPWVLSGNEHAFALRGTFEDPEPEELIEDEEEDALEFQVSPRIERGIPNVWVRYNVDGKPFRNWKVASLLGFADTWGSEPG